MTRWWIGVALTVGVFGAGAPAWAQVPMAVPMPEPAACGPGGCPPGLAAGPAEFGPLNPQQAPPGPPGNLGLPADLPGAFTDCPPKQACGCFAYLGAMALQRQRLGRSPAAVVDRVNRTNLDTGDVPRIGRDVVTVQNFEDIDPNMAWGVRGTVGYLFGNELIELSGWHIFANDASALTVAPGRLFQFFTNPPLGFEGDNGLWRQADVAKTSLRTDLTNAELNYRWWNSGVSAGELIIGARYVGEQERLTMFTGDDDIVFRDINGFPDPRRQANYSVLTHNNLVLGQLGFECHVPLHTCVALTGVFKGAWGANFLDTDFRLKRGDDAVQLDRHRSDVLFSHLYEVGLFADVFLTDQCRLRAGYNILWLVDIAEAVDQINYNLATQGQGDIKQGSAFFHGPVIEVQIMF
jgi:hypothetical protein